MSLFRVSMRSPAILPDESVRRYIAALRADLEPDPLFRRRLRGVVVNRFVSAREGLDAPARGPSRMGRLGRTCLYASFILVSSVGGTMAASRGALPGDLLYPVKLEIESIRMRTMPAHMRDELAAYALAERINELGRLVEAGELDRAAALAPAIQDGYAQLAAHGVADARFDGAFGTRLEVLEGLLDSLPAEAHEAIDRAMVLAPAQADASAPVPRRQTETGGVADGARVPPGAAADSDRRRDRPSLTATSGGDRDGPATGAEITPIDRAAHQKTE